MQNSGLDMSTIDHQVRAQDDLFRHMNGRWIDGTEIPDDRPLEGAFTQLRDESEIAVRRIIEDAADAGGDATALQTKIGDLYASFMDEDRIDARGAAPVADDLAAVYATTSAAELMALMGRLAADGVAGLYQFYINNDAGDPTRCVFHLVQGGLGLPDESYYREDKFAGIRDQYLEHLGRLLPLAGVGDPAAPQKVLELETRIASHHLDSVSCRNPQLTYNLVTAADLAQMSPSLETWFTALGVDEGRRAEVVLAQPDFIRGAQKLLADVALEHWQHWLAAQLLHSAAPFLAAEFVAEDFSFYGSALSGTPMNKERWKRGVGLVEGALGEAVGQLYVERHFPPEHKERMEELVANLLEAYRQSISSLEWMSGETIGKALDKLSKFNTKIGYPDAWIDYTELHIESDDLLGNVRRSARFELARQLDKIGKPIDRQEWLITPQTVNAYYNPTMNEIVFPAAILQPPFFDADADMAANYGGIGAVIGHEVGHGFDDMGSQFDGDGVLRNWWNDADREAFEALTARLVDQYNALSPREAAGHTVNGSLTLGENIGDLGGMLISYKAYRISLQGHPAPVIDSMSGPQRFFASWAQAWRQKIRPEEAVRRLTIDPHSPNEFRCNAVVQNLDEFHEAFDVGPADELWLDPGQRVRIW
ncbi:M13 family metallopeptidase [Arthrobacter castelli]|uniref:M13 family metallopeptidase n=1 Tax=Arthrobacter castelli TaxID=271431 RepID=UPI00041FFC69|nr:M13-type metalloendopeptidase [Arthrobacter castelli]